MHKKINLLTAASIVIANMIGTGVFTSLGFQLSSAQNSWTIFILWLLGGVLSLFGAFAYAELGTYFKETGGDYIFLSRIFHPMLGYLSAWTCLTVGFSAPVALSAKAFTKYLSVFGIGDSNWLAIAVILLIGIMHSFTIRHSSRFQNIGTAIKIIFIIVLIVLGVVMPYHHPNAIKLDDSWLKEIAKPGFAVSMIYVSYAYVGWSSAAFISGEIQDARKNLPTALIGSTLFVTVLYVLFQFVLMKIATVDEMKNREEVTLVAFENLFGKTGGKWVGLFIAIQLVATISSYLWVGSRVTWSMANEYKLWKPLAKTNRHKIPVRSLWVYVIVSILLTVSGSFEKVLFYAGFVLQVMSTLTIAASLFLKKTNDKTVYKSPFKPVLQILFLLFSLAVLVFTFYDRPTASLVGLSILAAGIVLYYFDKPSLTDERASL